ncbi:transcriptional regulator [Actinomycetota bacterium]
MEAVHHPPGYDEVLAWPACFLVMAALGEDRGIVVDELRRMVGVNAIAMRSTVEALREAGYLEPGPKGGRDRPEERVSASAAGRAAFLAHRQALRRLEASA